MKGLILSGMAMVVLSVLCVAQVNHQGTQTNGSNSSAIGLSCNASAMASFASGINSSSPGIGSHALGMNAQSQGQYSISLGNSVTSSGTYSLAMGTFVRSVGSKSMVLGLGYPSSYLVNNTPNSLMVGFNSNLPTLFISSSQGPGTYGKMGIATSTPTARLDVNAGEMNGLIIRNANSSASTIGIQCISDQADFTAFALIENGDTNLRIASNGAFRTANTLIAKEVKVRMDVWKDDILREPENLISLDSLSRFISENHHLPGMLSEKEALGSNVDVGQLCVDLLGKIEELTLYVLDLKRENNDLAKRQQSTSNPKEIIQ